MRGAKISPVVLSLALNASAVCATVRINFIDSFGQSVPFKVEKFQACCLATSPEYTRNFHGALADGIPEIEFTYRVKPLNSADFLPAEGKARVIGDNAFITIEAQPNHAGRIIDFIGMVVSGTISESRVRGHGPTWVSLISPYGSGKVRDAAVDAGHFTLRDIREPGNYIVVVCRGTQILASQGVRVTFGGDREINIQISK